jgi:hypothetical protein
MFWPKVGRVGSHGARDNTVSVHITSSASGRTLHRTFSWRAVQALIVAGGLVVLTVLLGLGGLVGWGGSTMRMRRLQVENDSLRVQFRRLGELESNLARMSELNDKMQKMLGVDLSTEASGSEVLSGSGDVRGGDRGGGPRDTSRVAGAGEAPLQGSTDTVRPGRGTKTN